MNINEFKASESSKYEFYLRSDGALLTLELQDDRQDESGNFYVVEANLVLHESGEEIARTEVMVNELGFLMDDSPQFEQIKSAFEVIKFNVEAA